MTLNEIKQIMGLTTHQMAELIEYSAPYVSVHKNDQVLSLNGKVIQRIVDKTFLSYEDLEFESLWDFIRHLNELKILYQAEKLKRKEN